MAVVTSTALAIASLATTVIGAGVQIYGQQQQKKTARRVAAFNAKVKENEAMRIDSEARENIRRKRKQNRRVLAKQRAKIGASGLLMAGSPLEALGDNASTLELEVFDMARAAESKRQSLLSQADQTIQAGNAQAKALGIAQVGTLLNAGSSVLGSTANFKQSGALPS